MASGAPACWPSFSPAAGTPSTGTAQPPPSSCACGPRATGTGPEPSRWVASVVTIGDSDGLLLCILSLCEHAWGGWSHSLITNAENVHGVRCKVPCLLCWRPHACWPSAWPAVSGLPAVQYQGEPCPDSAPQQQGLAMPYTPWLRTRNLWPGVRCMLWNDSPDCKSTL